MQALSISSSVAEVLKQSRRGTVLATFARSCYLELDGTIIAVVAEELLNGPLNVVIRNDPAFPFDRITQGLAVTATAEAIDIEGAPSISLSEAVPWHPALAPWSIEDVSGIAGNLTRLIDRVIAEAPADSFMHYVGRPLDDHSEIGGRPAVRIRHALAVLWMALRKGSPDATGRAAERLAGLGGGLTPSGDDVLVGALVALAAMPWQNADQFCRVIVNTATGRTNKISEAYVRAAARGEASEAWQRLLAALAGESAENVIAAGRRVMAFGETSGADMLAGFLLATNALLSTIRLTSPKSASRGLALGESCPVDRQRRRSAKVCCTSPFLSTKDAARTSTTVSSHCVPAPSHKIFRTSSKGSAFR